MVQMFSSRIFFPIWFLFSFSKAKCSKYTELLMLIPKKPTYDVSGKKSAFRECPQRS